MMSTVSNQIEELRKYARKWSEWNGFNAAMPVLPSTNIRLLRSAADTIEALDRPTGKWVNREKCQVNEDAYEVATCSECRAEITIEYPYDSYCPNCGVKMKRENYE